MPTTRSDTAYNHWREASEKFDYYITGLTGALTAYVGEKLAPEALGLNAATLEVGALVLLIASTICGFKRIELVVHLFKLQANQLYAQEVTGSSVVATQHAAAVNTATGEIFTPGELAARAQKFAAAAEALEPTIQRNIKKAFNYYRVRNITLLVGFLTLVTARVLAGYLP